MDIDTLAQYAARLLTALALAAAAYVCWRYRRSLV